MIKVKLYRNVLIAVMVVLIITIGVLFSVLHIKRSERMRKEWLLQQEARLPYDYAKDATVVKLSADSSTWGQAVYDAEYDFDNDMLPENVRIQMLDKEGIIVAAINIDGMKQFEIELEQAQDTYVISIVGITVGEDKMFALVESVYTGGMTMGYIRCHVFKVADDEFIKLKDIYYSGVIGSKGYMVEGVVANNMQDDLFKYDVKKNQNGYIYERSRVFADLRELGIGLPYETINNPIVTYNKNVIGIFNIIVS